MAKAGIGILRSHVRRNSGHGLQIYSTSDDYEELRILEDSRY
jgi:hypothetical protein